MWKAAILAAAIVLSPAAASAGQNEFCAGFQAGFKAAFETRRMIPQIPPICPIPPIGGDNFQSGYEAGLLLALSRMGR